MKFKHLHTSSRFDRSLASLEKALDNYMSQSDLITITEIGGTPRTSRLNEKGWAHHVPNVNYRDESTIAWRKSLFTLIYEESFKTSAFKGVQKVEPYAGFVVLRTIDGKVLVVGSCHLPHGMSDELKNRKITTALGRAFVEESRAFKKRGKELKKQFKADAILLVADWNIDIKANWAQLWFKAFAPTFKVNWQNPYPVRGTHAGGRIIDISLFKGLRLAVRPVILPHDASSDHTPYRETYVFA